MVIHVIELQNHFGNLVFYHFQGELKFFVNGESQGVAAENIPEKVYAIVNLYGRCAQVTVVPQNDLERK